ncbi:MAG: uridine kinase [Patescibacteria group bacterium]|jgi:uridine kinase
MAESFIIAIAGGSGSGKSTLTDNLAHSALAGRVSVLRLDYYFRPENRIPLAADGSLNYDHPSALDIRRFVLDLRILRQGQPVEVNIQDPRMARIEQVAEGGTKRIPAAPIIVVDGFLALWPPAARSLFDFSVFLDAPVDLRLKRRLPVQNRRYLEEVFQPMEARYVMPTKTYADLVLNVAALPPDLVLQQVLDALQLRHREH